MRAMELSRVIAVHVAETIRRVLWELPLRLRSWTAWGIGQLLSLAIVDADSSNGRNVGGGIDRCSGC